MLFYFLPYIYTFFISMNLLFSNFQRFKPKHIFLMILPAFLIAVLRGDVGTDTFFYLKTFEDYYFFGESAVEYEPGFNFLIKILMSTGLSPRAGLAFVATLTTFVLCRSFSKTKNQLLVFALLFFPLFYYDFTMNGLRYGLSFAVATLAIDNLYQKKYKYTVLYSLLALSFQYSAMLVLFPFIASLIKKRYLIIISVLLTGIIVLFPEYFVFISDRISGKADSYKEIFAPSITTGLAPLFTVFLLYFNYLIYNKKGRTSMLLHLIILLEIASFVLTKFSYAGTRFQGAYLYCMLVFLKHNSEDIVRIKRYTINLAFVSIFSIIVFLKNISVVVEDDYTPYLPYKFYWEENK